MSRWCFLNAQLLHYCKAWQGVSHSTSLCLVGKVQDLLAALLALRWRLETTAHSDLPWRNYLEMDQAFTFPKEQAWWPLARSLGWKPCEVPGWWLCQRSVRRQLRGTAAPSPATTSGQASCGQFRCDSTPLMVPLSLQSFGGTWLATWVFNTSVEFFFNVLPLLNVFVLRQPSCLLSTL